MKGICRSGDYRKYYEVVLSAASSSETKQQAVMSILKLAMTDDSHFSFLLNQIDWFCTSNKELIPLLNKIIRLYRGTSREACKVIYNLLADGLTIEDINIPVVDVIAHSLTNVQDRSACFSCLRDNYPHKVCPLETHLSYQNSLLELCKRVPSQRIQFLEMILENLAYFDTEMALGEEYCREFITEDEKILALKDHCGDLQHKYDFLLSNLLKNLSEYSPDEQMSLMKQVFVIFEKVIMLVDNTKIIQIVIFYLAQLSNELSSSFMTLIIATILENYRQGSKRKFLSALQYLTSYICRSCRITTKKVKKLANILINQLKEKISSLEDTTFEKIHVNEFREEHYQSLQLVQSILVIGAEFPEIKGLLKEEISGFIRESSRKLDFESFINPQILQAHEIEHKKEKRGEAIEYTNKFIPIFLPETQKLIKMKMKMNGKRVRKGETAQKEGNPTKRGCYNFNGNQTPVTIGENQLQGRF